MKSIGCLNFSLPNIHLSAFLCSQLLVAANASALSSDQANSKITVKYPDAVITEIREIPGEDGELYEVEFESGGETYEAVMTRSGEFKSIEEDSRQPWIVGLGAMYDTGIYKDQSTGVEPVPLVSGEVGNFWMQGLTLGYYAYRSDSLEVSPILQVSPGRGYDKDDTENNSRLYDGLEDRKTAVEAGLTLNYRLSWADLSTTVLADAGDSHSGFSTEIGLSQDFHPSQTVMVTPSISATYHSSNFNQYYFGIDEELATGFRPAYEAGSGVDYAAEVTAIWRLSQSWSVMGQISHTLLDNAIEDSPLVDEGHETSVLVGVGYAF
ncbi:MipA/OmpV family protein [Hahella ganghwensis]|uniref:MipA/OmpV family protein n=1 Tax=Hahella ganghwensis TaxID=286420 RepID=UPI00036493CB|nr:MipA/OmpV family protein [Hahella ganghwensis]